MTPTTAIPIPPKMTNEHATTAVSRDTSRATASISNVPRINATKSIIAQYLPHFLQHEIAT
jgi:hypothetical protein